MSQIKATTLSNLAGSKTVPTDTVVDGSAKAWVNFNGTGTVAIRRAFNVSSITDLGVGSYGVNFLNALVDANYGVVCTGQTTASFPNPIAWADPRIGTFTTSVCYITNVNGSFANADSSAISVAIFS